MTSRYIPKKVRQRVKAAARNRCGYCLCSQDYVYIELTIEHIIPTALGGSDEESNLWLSCGRGNGGKGVQVDGYDFVTEQQVPLFNPRTQVWKDHFRWDSTGIQIIGLTAIGRVTVEALKLNAPQVLVVRRNWVSVGWHPPEDSL